MNKIYERMAMLMIEAEAIEDDPKRTKSGMAKDDAANAREHEWATRTQAGMRHVRRHGHTGMYDHIAHMPGMKVLIDHSRMLAKRGSPKAARSRKK